MSIHQEFRLEALLNGFYLITDRKSGLRCTLNRDFTIRHGDLHLTKIEREEIRQHFILPVR